MTARALTRRSLLGSGVGLVGLTAAACGAGGSTGDAKPAADLPPATVNFWHWGTVGADNYLPTFQTVSDKFMAASPKIKVVNQMPADYDNKLVVGLASDTAPDVFLQRGPNARQWFNVGTTRDVQAYVSKDKNAANELKSVIKVFTDYYTVNGKLIGIPWDYSTIATVFNVDHVREAGLTLPAQLGDKWDWNMALEYAQKMTKKANNPPRWGILAESTGETGWFNWIAANSASFFDQSGKAVINSPAAVAATQWLVDLIHKHQLSPTRQELGALAASNQKIVGLQQGRLSMTFNGDWNFQPIGQGGTGLSWDVSYIPRSPTTKKTASIGNLRGLVVSQATKVPEQAWAFVAYTLKKEVQEIIPPQLQEVPAREDVALALYADPAKAGPPQNRKALADAIKAVTPLPWHDTAPRAEWNPIIDKWRNDMWDNKVTVQEGLRQMQDELQKLIDQYKK
ncbi:MAG TPA: sugar ABC transporter substrate-binding protein [Chloroflexota bacterium]|nr:sugar ABC transporter substrate-binding protein [Chloroflexota bacterium]